MNKAGFTLGQLAAYHHSLRHKVRRFLWDVRWVLGWPPSSYTLEMRWGTFRCIHCHARNITLRGPRYKPGRPHLHFVPPLRPVTLRYPANSQTLYARDPHPTPAAARQALRRLRIKYAPQEPPLHAWLQAMHQRNRLHQPASTGSSPYSYNPLILEAISGNLAALSFAAWLANTNPPGDRP